MERHELIGRWKLARYGPMAAPDAMEMELRDDGTAVTRTRTGGKVFEECSRWEYVDDSHWHLLIEIPPDPDMPGLEDGARERVEYEVTSFTGSEMSLMQFDYEFPFVYQRVTP